LGAVNVKLSDAFDTENHLCLADFAIRLDFQVRDIDQVSTAGTRLSVYPGIPHPNIGADFITYNGMCPTLISSTGKVLDAFTLPISRP
jgi:hypothetical protein